MKHGHIVILVSAFSVLAGEARAYDCTIGGEQVVTFIEVSLGVDTSSRAVLLKGRTTRSVADYEHCPGWVRVEGWITEDPAGVRYHAAEIWAQLGYPGDIGRAMLIGCAEATYRGDTKHWFIHNGWWGDPWTHIGDDFREVTAPGCITEGGGPPGNHQPAACDLDTGQCWDPVLLDTSGNGYRLTSAADGVHFDLDADGEKEQIAWTEESGDDGWLALDRNGNGVIDDGRELFSNFTPAYADRPSPTAGNGFGALALLENPSYGVSNGDQVIDSRDAVYARLLVWIDRNDNGISEPSELSPLADVGLLALETDPKERQKKRDPHGNAFLQRGVSWWANAETRIPRQFYDVWLRRD